MKHWLKNVDVKIVITYKRNLKVEFLKMNKSYCIIIEEKMHKKLL